MTTVQQIERSDWGDPPADSSFLVRRCLELRRKPLTLFTAEDLRIMLGQRLAVPILLPLATEVLATDPLVEGDLYPGDLLCAVLRLPASAWSAIPAERQCLASAVAEVDLAEADLPEVVRDAVAALLRTGA